MVFYVKFFFSHQALFKSAFWVKYSTVYNMLNINNYNSKQKTYVSLKKPLFFLKKVENLRESTWTFFDKIAAIRL